MTFKPDLADCQRSAVRARSRTRARTKRTSAKAAEVAGGGEPDGLVNYLVVQARQNPGPFMSLLGKVVPTQVSGEDDKDIRNTVRKYSRGAA
jgi:hypothetical protein